MKKEARNEMTGYPSIDRPWLKYYSDEAINVEIRIHIHFHFQRDLLI